MKLELTYILYFCRTRTVIVTLFSLYLILGICLPTAQAVSNTVQVLPMRPVVSRGARLQPLNTNLTIVEPPRILPMKPARESFSARFVTKASCDFRVGTAPGDKDVCYLTLRRSGHLRIEATWQGAPDRLELDLTGPGQTGPYARKVGSSPLRLDFGLQNQVLERGNEWIVSVVNASEQGPGSGTLNVEISSQPSNQATPPSLWSEKIQRTILTNGTVELRYPDGTIKRFRSDGYDVINPDGTAIGARYIQTPPATPPDLPGEASVVDWLKWQNDSLLDMIRWLVDGDENMVAYYLKREEKETSTLYGQMYSRTRLIDALVSPPGSH